jgi:hypothetical protein
MRCKIRVRVRSCQLTRDTTLTPELHMQRFHTGIFSNATEALLYSDFLKHVMSGHEEAQIEVVHSQDHFLDASKQLQVLYMMQWTKRFQVDFAKWMKYKGLSAFDPAVVNTKRRFGALGVTIELPDGAGTA